MPSGIGGFGGAAVETGTEFNDDVPDVIITPSGDVLNADGEIIHSAGGGRGQSRGGVLHLHAEEEKQNNNSQLIIGLIALKLLGVF